MLENPENNNDKKDDKNRGLNLLIIIILAAAFASVLLFIHTRATADKAEELTYDQFTAMVEKGEISKVVLKDGKLIITPKSEEGKDEKDIETQTVRLIGTELEELDVGMRLCLVFLVGLLWILFWHRFLCGLGLFV